MKCLVEKGERSQNCPCCLGGSEHGASVGGGGEGSCFLCSNISEKEIGLL